MHDVVIVGAGTAGCVLASRLTEDSARRVLLLEAGGSGRGLEVKVPAAFSRLYGSKHDWGYRTTPQAELDEREILFPRGKGLGGSSTINAMMAIRGHRDDQQGWPPGWAWEDVEPLYTRAADGPFAIRHQTDPSTLTRDFLAAAAHTGIPSCDLTDPLLEGAGLTPVSIERGRRWSVVDGYLAPARSRPNLEIVTGAVATRIVVENGRAVAVVYLENGREREAPGREVVLALGAIDTPKLLLLSGIGAAETIETHGIELVADVPGVGKNLLDHLANGILVATKPGIETLTSATKLRHLGRWLVSRRGPLTSNVAEAAAFVRTRSDLAAPDLELIFAPVPFEEEGTKEPDWHGITIAAILLQPESSGAVTLRSRDPLAPPMIDPRYLTDTGGRDLRTLLAGVRLARRLAAAEPLASRLSHEVLPGGGESDDELAAHIRAHSQTLYHPVGTCRMGIDPQAPLDPMLRVRGLERLRVVDASAIPRLPRGHTNWPVVMLAERAADLIRAA